MIRQVIRAILKEQQETSCCLGCHFDYEDQNAFSFLSPEQVQQLRSEHDKLKQAGYPRQDMIAHAEREMKCFRQHCPDNVVDRIDRDHQEYVAGRLHTE